MFRSVVALFRDYMGMGLTMAWFVLSLAYLWVNEKEQHIRIIFLYLPVIALLLYFNPLFAMLVYGIIGEEVYYRLLWMLPVTAVIAYTCVSICGRIVGKQSSALTGGAQNTRERTEREPSEAERPDHGAGVQEKSGREQAASRFLSRRQSKAGRTAKGQKRIRAAYRKKCLAGGAAAAVMAGSIIICGSYIYDNPNFVKAQNPNHVPDSVVFICDTIEVPGREVMAAFPLELVQYVRQYSPLVCMPYGREMLVQRPGWRHESALCEAMEEKEMDLKRLVPLAREAGCHFCILRADKAVLGEPEDYGWSLVGETEGFVIYRDTEVELIIPESE